MGGDRRYRRAAVFSQEIEARPWRAAGASPDIPCSGKEFLANGRAYGTNQIALLVDSCSLAVSPAAGEIRTFTTLLPPSPLPPGVAANGHGVAEIRLEPGVRERFKINVEDVAVIGDPADPAFCLGLYEAVLIVNGAEVRLPAFPGFVVACRVAGDPRGRSASATSTSG